MSDEHRDHLKSLVEFRFYKNYIDKDLAGDFAYDVSKTIKAREKRIKELEDCLDEAVNLMEDVITGDYEPDSFTTQPWKIAIVRRIK